MVPKKPEEVVSVTPAGNKEAEPVAVSSELVALDNEVREIVQVNHEAPVLTPEQKKAGVQYSPESAPVSETTGDKAQITIPQAKAEVKKNDQNSSFFGYCLTLLRSIRKVNFLKLKKGES